MVAYIYPSKKMKNANSVGLLKKLWEIREYYSSKLDDAEYFSVSYTEWKSGKKKYLKEFKQIAKSIMTLDKSEAPSIKGKINHLEDLVREIEDSENFSLMRTIKISSSIFFLVDFCDYLAKTLIRYHKRKKSK